MNKTISLFVLVSVAIHAAVLGLISFNSPTEIAVGSLMRVSIQASSPATSKSTKTRRKVIEKSLPNSHTVTTQTKPVLKSAQKKVVTAMKTSSPAASLVHESSIVEQPEDIIATPQTVIAKLENSSLTSENILPQSTSSLLHSDLERAFALHFYYPRRAIKRGWQGDVKISLRIEADGQLSRVRILNGSGHILLDNAAMTSIDKVEILPTAVALLNGRSLDLILPVEYRLL